MNKFWVDKQSAQHVEARRAIAAFTQLESYKANAPKGSKKQYTTPLAAARAAKKSAEKAVAALQGDALKPSDTVIATIQVCFTTEECQWVSIIQTNKFTRDEVAQFLADFMAVARNKLVLIHNAKFELAHFADKFQEFDLGGCRGLRDTKLREGVIAMGRKWRTSLGDTASRYDVPDGIAKGSVAISDWWGTLTDEQVAYAAADVLLLHHIYVGQAVLLDRHDLNRTSGLEHAVLRPVVAIEAVRNLVDGDAVDRFASAINAELATVLPRFHGVFGAVNPASHVQMLTALEAVHGIRPTMDVWDKATQKQMTKASVSRLSLALNGLTHKAGVEEFVRIKALNYWRDLALKWKHDGVQPELKQLPFTSTDEDEKGGAASGRFSTSPNLQNITALSKQFLVAPPGYVIVSVDYSQIELRIMAVQSGDTTLLCLFNDGVSPHVLTYERVFNKACDKENDKRGYTLSKNINFGFLYGMWPKTFVNTVAKATNGDIMVSESEASRFRQVFFETYAGLAPHAERVQSQAMLDGFATTSGGRKRARATWELNDNQWKRAALNHTVQGTCADIEKHAIVLAHQRLQHSKIFCTVHDSTEFLVQEDKLDSEIKIIVEAKLEAAYKYVSGVPIEVDVQYGKCWGNKPKEFQMFPDYMYLRGYKL